MDGNDTTKTHLQMEKTFFALNMIVISVAVSIEHE